MCRHTSHPQELQQQLAQRGRRQILEHYPYVMQPVNVFQRSIWRSEIESDPIGAKRHPPIQILARLQSKGRHSVDIYGFTHCHLILNTTGQSMAQTLHRRQRCTRARLPLRNKYALALREHTDFSCRHREEDARLNEIKWTFSKN
jgi:hypothetical protein